MEQNSSGEAFGIVMHLQHKHEIIAELVAL